MKTTIGILLIIVLAGCTRKTDNDTMNKAAKHFAGVFITDSIPSATNLQLEGRQVVKHDDEHFYYINGTIEGFSSYNMPVSVQRYSETLHYLGGDPNDRKNWECLEIYIGKK